MSRLRTVRVSRAAADQRRGRAGRTAPGICYRLWAAEEDVGLLERDRPEILDADLTPLAFDLALAGIVDASRLRWLDAPPAPALAHARELLQQLGAISDDLRITEHGRAMARLGTHPRLAHMLLRGRDLGAGAMASVVAALLDERDAGRDPNVNDVDLRGRVARIAAPGSASVVDAGALRRVRLQTQTWRRTLGVKEPAPRDEQCGLVIALAFPDRIAQRRSGSRGRYLLRNGIGVELPDGASLSRSRVPRRGRSRWTAAACRYRARGPAVHHGDRAVVRGADRARGRRRVERSSRGSRRRCGRSDWVHSCCAKLLIWP